MGGHVSDDVRVVCDAGRAGVAGPAVGPGRGAGARLAPRKACRLSAEKSSIRARRIRPGPPSPTSTAPATNNLPWWLRRPIPRRRSAGHPWSGRRSGFRPLRPGPPAACALVRPWPGAAWWRATMRSCRNPSRAASGVAAPRSRWSAWPSDRRPRTTRSAPAWSRASPYRPSPRSACDSRRIHGCMPWSRAPTPGCCRRPDRRSLPASARWPGRRRRLLRLENAVGTPTGNGGSRSFLGIPRVMMFTLCSITTLAPRHHISWSRTLRDQALCRADLSAAHAPRPFIQRRGRPPNRRRVARLGGLWLSRISRGPVLTRALPEFQPAAVLLRVRESLLAGQLSNPPRGFGSWAQRFGMSRIATPAEKHHCRRLQARRK